VIHTIPQPSILSMQGVRRKAGMKVDSLVDNLVGTKVWNSLAGSLVVDIHKQLVAYTSVDMRVGCSLVDS